MRAYLTRMGPWQIVLAVLVAVFVVWLVARNVDDVINGSQRGQQAACEFYRQHGITPPPDQTCP